MGPTELAAARLPDAGEAKEDRPTLVCLVVDTSSWNGLLGPVAMAPSGSTSLEGP